VTSAHTCDMELDTLLEDLESRLSQGDRENFSWREESRQWTESTTTTTTRHRETQELPVQPRFENKMATMAISNNINELDILLQDLSAARYSGHVETLETSVTESRSFSLGQEMSGKLGPVGHFSSSQSHSHDVHAVERSEGRVTRDQSEETEGGRWEYRGQGIWETRDIQSGGEVKRWSAHSGSVEPEPEKLESVSRTSTFSRTRTFSPSTEQPEPGRLYRNPGGPINELDNLMTKLSKFEIDGVREVDTPLFSQAPQIPLGDLGERLDKETPIEAQTITAMGRTWRLDLFCCSSCGMELSPGDFREREGKPYCEACANSLFSARICAYCSKAIEGRCITAMFRKFHPECFVCSFCLKQLNKGTFKEQGDKPYCHMCFDRLFG